MMLRYRSVRLSFSIVLLGLTWRVASNLVSNANPGLALLVAVAGTALLLTSVKVASEGDKRIQPAHILAILPLCFLLGFEASPWQRTVAIVLAGLMILPIVFFDRRKGGKSGSACGHRLPGGRPAVEAACVACIPATTSTLRERYHNHLAALSISASILTVSWASTLVLSLIAWRLHDVPLPGWIHTVAAGLVRSCGRSGDHLTFWTGTDLQMVRVTFESLGLYEIWFILWAGMTFLALSRVRLSGRSLMAASGTIAVYAIARFLMLSALAMELGRSDLMWQSHYAIISWLPLALVLRIRPDGGSTHSADRRSTLASLVPVFAGVAITFACGFEDPGISKQGRILIDETHADWEWVQEPFDTTAYGIRAEYNYYCLADYLRNWYQVEVNNDGISSSLLDTVDILIVKTPTEAFSAQEIEAITQFVSGGGGLLLIGDHTNLFGMTTYLNAIAKRFGIQFRCDDTFDLTTTGLSTWTKPAVYHHPVARDVHEFEFLTSCTLRGDLKTRPVLVGRGLGCEDVDYAHPNFFGNIAFDLHDGFGLFLQAGAKVSGGGRILLFTDSTCLSNFCIFGPGRPELLMGMIDYLNREGTRYPMARPLIWMILAGLGWPALMSLKKRIISPGWLSIGILLGSVIGAPLVSGLNSALYGSLSSRALPRRLLFEVAHTEVSFFNYLALPATAGHMGFEELYLCAQRVGAYPYPGTVLDAEQSHPEGIVIVNPSLDFNPEEVRCLRDYVGRGGRLLLIDSALNSRSTANQVLAAFGITLGLGSSSVDRSSGAGPVMAPVLRIYGGEALSTDGDGGVTAAQATVGHGKVLVAVDSFRYSHHILGPVLQRSGPTPFIQRIYGELYEILGETVGPRLGPGPHNQQNRILDPAEKVW